MPGQAVSRAAALPTLPVLRRPKKCCGFSCNTPRAEFIAVTDERFDDSALLREPTPLMGAGQRGADMVLVRFHV